MTKQAGVNPIRCSGHGTITTGGNTILPSCSMARALWRFGFVMYAALPSLVHMCVCVQVRAWAWACVRACVVFVCVVCMCARVCKLTDKNKHQIAWFGHAFTLSSIRHTSKDQTMSTAYTKGRPRARVLVAATGSHLQRARCVPASCATVHSLRGCAAYNTLMSSTVQCHVQCFTDKLAHMATPPPHTPAQTPAWCWLACTAAPPPPHAPARTPAWLPRGSQCTLWRCHPVTRIAAHTLRSCGSWPAGNSQGGRQ